MILIHFSIMIDWLERKSYENDAILVWSCKLHNIIHVISKSVNLITNKTDQADYCRWYPVDQYESIIHDHETSIIIDWSNYLYL